MKAQKIINFTNKNEKNNAKNKENNIKNDIDNISLKKEGNGSSQLEKIKSSLNKLIIGQNENNKKNNRNKQPLEKRTIRRRERSEIINTEPVKINLNFGINKQNKGKNKFKDTKNGFCMFIKKRNINPQNIRNLYLKEKQEINIINNRVKTLDYNKNDKHPLSAANEALPRIKK